MQPLNSEQEETIKQYWQTYVDGMLSPPTILRAMGNLVEDHAQHPLDAFKNKTTGEVMEIAMNYYYAHRFDLGWTTLLNKSYLGGSNDSIERVKQRLCFLESAKQLRQYLQLPIIDTRVSLKKTLDRERKKYEEKRQEQLNQSL